MVKSLGAMPNGWFILAAVWLIGTAITTAIREAFSTFRTIAAWVLGKKNGNGYNGNGNGHDPAIGEAVKVIRSWVLSEGRDISVAVQRGAASLGALLDISQQHLEAQQEHTREQRRQHAAVLDTFAKKL